MGVQRLAGDAGLDGDVHIFGVNFQNLVHLRQVDADAAFQRANMPLHRAADAERDNRRAGRGANLDDGRHFLGRMGIDHGLGRFRRVPAGVGAVMVAHRHGGRDAVPDDFADLGNGGFDVAHGVTSETNGRVTATDAGAAVMASSDRPVVFAPKAKAIAAVTTQAPAI